jgi:hypothetical protein
MNLVLKPRVSNSFAIASADTEGDWAAVGYVHLRTGTYCVERADVNCAVGQGVEVAIVKSLDDAIPALAAYFEKNPSQWKREGVSKYSRFTQFGKLWVAKDRLGEWWAYRDGTPFGPNGSSVTFPSRQMAQRTADAHACDWLAQF